MASTASRLMAVADAYCSTHPLLPQLAGMPVGIDRRGMAQLAAHAVLLAAPDLCPSEDQSAADSGAKREHAHAIDIFARRPATSRPGRRRWRRSRGMTGFCSPLSQILFLHGIVMPSGQIGRLRAAYRNRRQ